MARLTIEEMRTIVAHRGGFCLSAKYINNKTKLKWQCSKKHIWDATPKNIQRGRWCPECYRLTRRKAN